MLEITTKMGMFGFMFILSIVFLVSLFVNYTNAKPSAQKKRETLSSISKKYFTFVTPATYTFSIWGIIYILAIIVVCVWWYIAINMNLVLFNQLTTVMILFLILSIINPLWIALLIKEYITVAWLVMLSLLAVLIVSYYTIPVLNNPYAVLLKIYYAIYMGWISIAFTLNTAILLVRNGVSFNSKVAVYASIIVLLVLTAVSVYILFAVNAFFFALTILWAFLGIYFQKDPRVANCKIVKRFLLAYSILIGICILLFAIVKISGVF